MRDNKTVYVVTAGDYSDYHIEAIFDDEGLAENYVELHNQGEKYGRAAVETWTVNEDADLARRGVKAWSVYFKEDGRVSSIYGSLDKDETESFEEYAQAYVSVRDPEPSTHQCRTMQKDEQTAIKVCAERRAQYLAEKAGIT